ncbi:MAG: hypothetical protein HW420_161 [Candidatus Nitrosotenuis sp.]|nr:hypothetical protein [Candidatus Nitrosotenuis sp.]
MKISEIEKDENAKTRHTVVRCVGLSHPAFPSTRTRLLLYGITYTLIIVKGMVRFSEMGIFRLLAMIILARCLN